MYALALALLLALNILFPAQDKKPDQNQRAGEDHGGADTDSELLGKALAEDGPRVGSQAGLDGHGECDPEQNESGQQLDPASTARGSEG